MKTVLITGAAGALGRALVARLREGDKYDVVATSHHSADQNSFQLDVCNPDQMVAAISRTKPNLIIHLAATFATDFDAAYAVNVESTRSLLNAVEKWSSNTRVLLVGSAAEYGVVSPHENPIREDRVLKPVSIYGLTKSWQTQLAGLYVCRGMNVVVARVFNLYGAGLKERLFVGNLQKQIEEVLAGKKAVIELGPLSATRDYLSTEEAAKQMLAIAEHAEPGGVYHVASGIPVTMRNLLTRHLSINKLDVAIVRESTAWVNHLGYDVPIIYADITNTMQLMKRGVCAET